MSGAKRHPPAREGTRPQQQRSKDTVQKILRTADKLFTKEGVAQVSLGKIARVMKLPTATMYRYFPNKEALVTLLMKQTLDLMINDASKRYESAVSLEEYNTVSREVLWATYEQVHKHPYLNEAYAALLTDRSQRSSLIEENARWVDIFFIAGRRFLTFDSDDALYRRLQVLNAAWNGTLRLTQLYDKPVADELMRETIEIFIRELN